MPIVTTKESINYNYVYDIRAMSIFKFIDEFLLFRWLFGSHKHNEPKRDVSDTNISHADRDFANDLDSHIGYGSRYDNSRSRYNRRLSIV